MPRSVTLAPLLALLVLGGPGPAQPTPPRARELGIVVDPLIPGPLNAITDVPGVAVGHATIRREESIRTGVTIIHPCRGQNAYRSKLPAAVYTGNGYGKAAGFTQVEELGTLEAPIALTNTLSVGTVLQAMVKRAIALPGNESVRSINVVVGETNDGWLNDIRGLHVGEEDVLRAWDAARGGPVPEGAVGAGTGTRCFGYKGGIGTASRVVGKPPFTVGVLVQTNFGGRLRIRGRPFPAPPAKEGGRDGSCMIVIATDAPLDARNLRRLAKRSFLALGRLGAVMANGSGDYAIAFSTHPANRVPSPPPPLLEPKLLPNARMTPLFDGVVAATEEAVLNSLVAAKTTTGRDGHTARAIDHGALRRSAR